MLTVCDFFPPLTKRYFVLERGILTYTKRATDVCITTRAATFLSFMHSDTCSHANSLFDLKLKKAKLHGCIDVGLSVMSIKEKAMCIDLDTEDNIFHLKVIPNTPINMVLYLLLRGHVLIRFLQLLF